MSDQTPVKVSAVEGIKEQSRYLAGDIGPELSDGLEHYGKSSETLLKFHGTYQQDDRDERGTGGLDAEGKKKKSYIFMVRTKIPGGKLTSQQLLSSSICATKSAIRRYELRRGRGCSSTAW